ncbi:LacI family DNA-binding transcriptional regulator [Bifidobacterium simiiventris]|uniref:LacI family DNA-binding transcriptional regulator n=1 Tax=Bifidobacterium simiiventris TaxID=2834434 RepID=UPI001C577DFE|nr:LacI family DNA-binding transcriptional regulator [Bifidobacterium simiiventris]
MVTINDVARAAGVSRATASYALRGDPRIAVATANKVRRVASQLRYTANLSARSLRSGRNGVIGVAIYELDRPYPAEMSAAMSNEISRRGCQPIVQQTSNSKEGEISILQRVTSQLCDGMIFSPGNVGDQELKILSHGKPMVLLDDSSLAPVFDSVDTPCVEGAAAAIRHLIDVGCRDIVVIGPDYGLLGDPCAAAGVEGRRMRGCLAAFEEAGMMTADVTARFVHTRWNADDARQCARDLVRSGRRFDGAFCLTDTTAMGFIRGLADCGVRVPDDVAVVGFDGIAAGANLVPSLTTIAVDLDDLARKAVDLLMRRICEDSADPAPPRRLTADFHLVQRESTRR